MYQRFINVLNFLHEKGFIKNDTDFAAKMDIATSRVADMKKGRRPITASFAVRISQAFPIVDYNYLINEDCVNIERNTVEQTLVGNGNFSTNNQSFNSCDQSGLIAQLRAENEHLKEQLAEARKDIEWCHDLINAMRGSK